MIRMEQPYSSVGEDAAGAAALSGYRRYPGGPPQTPYDATAQTLPLLMGVDVHDQGAIRRGPSTGPQLSFHHHRQPDLRGAAAE